MLPRSCRRNCSYIIGTGNVAMEIAVGIIPTTIKILAEDTYSIAGVAVAAEGDRFIFFLLIVALSKYHAIT